MPAASRSAAGRRKCVVRRRVADRALHVAEIRGDRDHLHRVDHAPGGLAPALHDEREHRPPAARLLALRERVLRMRLEARDSARARPPGCDSSQRAIASAFSRMRLHANAQRLHALQAHPRVEGRDRGPGGAHEAEERPVHEVRAPRDGAGEHAALSVDVLGGRMHDEVRAERDRALQRGRAHGVVDGEHAPSPSSRCRRARRCRRPRTPGFDGVSAKSSRVFGRIALRPRVDVRAGRPTWSRCRTWRGSGRRAARRYRRRRDARRGGRRT